MISKNIFEIREAKFSDYVDISRLASSANFRLSPRQIEIYLKDEGTKTTVLSFSDGLAGFATSGSFVSGEITLKNIFISPPLRRQGFAGKMLSENLSYWKEKGALKCLLELRSSNESARKFYTNYAT